MLDNSFMNAFVEIIEALLQDIRYYLGTFVTTERHHIDYILEHPSAAWT